MKEKKQGSGPTAALTRDELKAASEVIQLLGLSELSKRWGVSKQRVGEITDARCPHWRKLDCGRVWLLHEIEEFEKTWDRRTGVHITPHKGRQDAKS